MPDAASNSLLNDLLVRLYRSLLQYTIECWPWTDAGQSAEQHAIEELAAKQREQVSRLVDVLDHRGQPIDYGNYPDWSFLHYVSLDYLLGKLIEDQTGLLAEVKRIRAALTADAEAVELASEVVVSEERHLARLKELAVERKQAVPA